MSRLIDKLTKATQAASQPMGFRTARGGREEPKILVIAGVKPDTTGQTGDYVAGADAVWLHSAKAPLSAKAIQPIIESIPNIPCGVSLEDTGIINAKALIKAGCDFLVFPDTSPIEAVPVEDEEIGKILQVESSLEDSMIRVINNLPVDAVIASGSHKANTPLAWHDLMSLQRLGLLLTKPLLVPVSPGISSSELRAICEADVDGVIIEADPSQSDLFKGIRQTISELPPRTIKKHGKSEALLPYSGSAKSTITPDEEEDDYE